MEKTATIFDIQRFSVHDGPGIRTTVFMKGCSLRCRWCHNPEGYTAAPQLMYHEEKCIGCGQCVQACPQSVHHVDFSGHHVCFEKCVACGQCVQMCPSSALHICGREMSVSEVVAEVLRDKPFYTPNGGVTFSGEEKLLYRPILSMI